MAAGFTVILLFTLSLLAAAFTPLFRCLRAVQYAVQIATFKKDQVSNPEGEKNGRRIEGGDIGRWRGSE